MLEQNEQPLILRQLTRILQKFRNPRTSAKQGDVSAAFGAQEFSQDNPPHYL